MYEAVTRGIRIRVTPQYLEEESAPDEGRFLLGLHHRHLQRGQRNGAAALAPLAHHRREGTHEEVRGPGVVGQTPVLAPGASFRYTSGCPLADAVGHHGRQLPDDDAAGEQFNVAIPAFSLDSPHARRSLN